MAEIQRRIVEKRERGLFSQLAHAKNDKETIATWKMDLIRILQVFNVCSVGPSQPSLISSFQTELALNTHTMVSGIRQHMLKGSEDNGGKDEVVSGIRTLPITE